MTAEPQPEIWYRYEDVAYAVMSSAEPERWTSQLRIELRLYRVVKKTPKGIWLVPESALFDERRFVLLSARRRFACPTKEAARASFRARKRRQLSIYAARAQRARHAIALIDIEGTREE